MKFVSPSFLLTRTRAHMTTFTNGAPNKVFVVSAARTPIGSMLGKLKEHSAVNLASIAINGCFAKINNAVAPEHIQHVYMGHVLQAGCKQAPVRQAAITSKMPYSTEATAVNKLCASGLKAVTLACQSLQLGVEDVVLAGGTESMSNAPFLLNRAPIKYGGEKIKDSIIFDGLTCAMNGIHMGECTEKLNKKYNITRADQDDFANQSYQKSLAATKSEILKSEIVGVPLKDGSVVEHDEEPSRYRPEKMSSLSTVFMKEGGTITAGNASKLNDGACFLILASEKYAKEHNLTPLAEIIDYADGACDPMEFGRAPAISLNAIFERQKQIKKEDVAMWEVNEAFSSVPLVVGKEVGIDMAKMNMHGGAVSMGHPVGMSGARIVAHMVHTLKSGELGAAGICNGGGGSTSILIRKL